LNEAPQQVRMRKPWESVTRVSLTLRGNKSKPSRLARLVDVFCGQMTLDQDSI
jgi:hypothetical protein